MERLDQGRKQAFTLIELLVVVAIISMLMAMLLPSLDKARGSARMVKCQAILRQIGTASAFYGADFNSYHLPQSVPTATPRRPYTEWFQLEHFHRSMGFPPTEQYRDAYNAPKDLICPDATWALNKPGTTQDKYATPPSSAGPDALHRIDTTYGHNARQLPNWSEASATVRGYRHANVRSPASRIFYMDSMWSDPVYHARHRYADIGENYIAPANLWSIAWRHLGMRDTGNVNVLFFDGHVSAMTGGVSDTYEINEERLWNALD